MQVISKLEELLNLKKSFSGKKDSLIKEQLKLLRTLESRETLEQHVFQGISRHISSAENLKEFNISPEEFSKILKEKNAEKNLIFIFREQISEIESQFKLLKELLAKQESSLDIKPFLPEEEKIYFSLNTEFQKILSAEKDMKQYFNDISRLTYHKGWFGPSRVISRILSGIKVTIRVNGLENIPKKGPCILAPHHINSKMDPMVFMAIIPRPIFFIASAETFIPVPAFGHFIKNLLGALPIKRDDSQFPKRLDGREGLVAAYDSSNSESIRKALLYLKYGDCIVFFPEGDARIGSAYDRANVEFLPLQPGLMTLAYLCLSHYGIKVPIIPIGLKYSGRNAIVNIGQPLTINPALKSLHAQALKQELELYTGEIFKRIVKLSS
jgi:1-acyl-sn-glycerol-3-phosphate acyltransferase